VETTPRCRKPYAEIYSVYALAVSNDGKTLLVGHTAAPSYPVPYAIGYVSMVNIETREVRSRIYQSPRVISDPTAIGVSPETGTVNIVWAQPSFSAISGSLKC